MTSEVIFTVATTDGVNEFYVYKEENVEEALKLITNYPEVDRLEFDNMQEFIACITHLTEVINKVSENKIEVSLGDNPC